MLSFKIFFIYHFYFLFGCTRSLLWCVSVSLWWLFLLWIVGSRCVGFSHCSTWAQEFWCMGLVAPWQGAASRPGIELMSPALAPGRASLVVQTVMNLPAMWETWVWPLGWDDPLEKEMAIHSSFLAWWVTMDRGTWQAIVHGVTKNQTQLRNFHLLLGKSSMPSKWDFSISHVGHATFTSYIFAVFMHDCCC